MAVTQTMMDARDEQCLLDLLNYACEPGSPVSVTDVMDVGDRVWRVGRWLICVFNDAGEWDYIAWVAYGQDVWGYENLPDSVKHWTPSDEARERVFHWTD